VSGLIAGNTGQIVAQLISIVTVVVWSLGSGFLVFYMLKSTMGIRVTRSEEMKGLDITEHDMQAYPPDQAVGETV
jgi:Amt family ammonium transporter